MTRNLLAFVLAAMSIAVGQEKPAMSFLLDAGKPYAYIEFDHTGDRKPVEPGESTTGLWLRFVNNCRVPVAVATFDPGIQDKGTGMIHDVVPLIYGKRPDSPEPPRGYFADFYSLTTLDPGDTLLFSVPLNHISQDWYIRVRFTLDVSPSKVAYQPYSYADFQWSQLPPAARESKEK